MIKRFILILCVVISHLHVFGQTAAEHFNVGVKNFSAQNYVAALAEFNKAIELDPNNSKAYNNRGIVKNILNDSTGSLTDFNKAIELEPENVSAYKNRALLKMRHKNYSEALDDFNKVLQLDPENAIALKNKKLLNKLLQKKITKTETKTIEQKKAITTISTIDKEIDTTKSPKQNTESLKIKKQVKETSGNPSVKSKKTKSLPVEEYVNQGRSQARSHKYKEAFEYYSKAIEIDSTYAQAYYYRGLLKSYLRNYNGEIQGYNEDTHVPFKKKYDDTYIRRELLKGDLGAIEDYTKAIQLNPKFVDAYYNRAMSFYNMKEYTNAIANFNNVIDLDKTFADAFYYRGMSKGILLDMNGACMDFVKAAELGNTEAKDILKDCK